MMLKMVIEAYNKLQQEYEKLYAYYMDKIKFANFAKETNELLAKKYNELQSRHDALKQKHSEVRHSFYQYKQRNPEPAQATTGYAQRNEVLTTNPPVQVWHKSGENGWISDNTAHQNFPWKLASEATVTIAYYDQYGNRVSPDDEVPEPDYINSHSNIYRKRTEHDRHESWDGAQGRT